MSTCNSRSIAASEDQPPQQEQISSVTMNAITVELVLERFSIKHQNNDKQFRLNHYAAAQLGWGVDSAGVPH
ncbi:uncharacterized protein N7469_010936 [Penicillium citrinum]|uniref:Uncharacterized protein n=1 Tax=Penicillium citrinum TaxID=5077 RepID=A0A9W9TGZ3_PENCI|nr:uncharacterized protein N7469_010936 [Penicillium citrinum]KAJ5222049.1 hypothetical protein N7469_010936 [Penicillium citrinum]